MVSSTFAELRGIGTRVTCGVVVLGTLLVIAGNLGAQESDVAKLLPRDVMLFVELDCAAFKPLFDSEDRMLGYKSFDRFYRSNVDRPNKIGRNLFLSVPSTILEDFISDHFRFAAETSSQVTLAFIPAEDREFSAVMTFEIESEEEHIRLIKTRLEDWKKAGFVHRIRNDHHVHVFYSGYKPLEGESLVYIPMAFAVVLEKRLWITSDLHLAETIIDRVENPQGYNSLADDNRKFQSLMRQTEADHSVARFFLDPIQCTSRHKFWKNAATYDDAEAVRERFGDRAIPYHGILAVGGQLWRSKDGDWGGKFLTSLEFPRSDEFAKLKLGPLLREAEDWLPEDAGTFFTVAPSPDQETVLINELVNRFLGQDRYFVDATELLVDPLMKVLPEKDRESISHFGIKRISTASKDQYASKLLGLQINDPREAARILAEYAEQENSRLQSQNHGKITIYSSGEVNPERRPHRHYTEAIRDAVSHVCLLDDRLLFCNDLEFLKTAIDVHKRQESSALGERLKNWAKRQARDQDRIMFYLDDSSVGPMLDSLLKQRPLQKMQIQLDYDDSEIKVFNPINQLGGSAIFFDELSILTSRTADQFFSKIIRQPVFGTMRETENSYEVEFELVK